MRHIVQANVELGVESLEFGLAFQNLALCTLALGDVLEGCHPTAIERGRDGHGDGAPIGQFTLDSGLQFACCQTFQDLADVLVRLADAGARLRAQFNQSLQRATRLDLVRLQVKQLEVAAVGDEQTLL